MTTDELKDLRDAIDAHLNGKSVQWKIAGREKWITGDPGETLGWDIHALCYRPAPEPKTRAWNKPEDVPGPVCWIRDPHQERLIVAISSNGIMAGSVAFGEVNITWGRIASGTEYSTDRKAWHPCTITE